MRSILSIILLLLVVISGCTEPQPDPQGELLKNIKIGQLAPAGGLVDNPFEMNYRIFTFQIPAENSNHIEKIFANLKQGPLHFSSYNTFISNGLLAGYGKADMWDTVSNQLQTAQAKRLTAETLIIFDEGSEMIFPVGIDYERTIFYKDKQGRIVGRSLVDGVLAWNFTAKTNPQIKGAADLLMTPVFVKNTDMLLANLSEVEEVKKEAFDFGRFSVRMRRDDFIILGPASYKTDNITLSSIFFNSPDNSGSIMLYLIVCARVSN